MIIDNNNHPENTIYFISALIIQTLVENTSSLSFINLYHFVKMKHSVSLSVLQYSIDWLYILGVVTRNSEGNIELCI